MHSGRMCTIRCSGHLSCHTHPLPHIPSHAHPPPLRMPLPHMPPTMNVPYHACPPPCIPPSCMAPTLPHMPPAIPAPSHAHSPDHADPPHYEQNDRQTGVKTLPCRNFVEGGHHRHRKLVRLCATITNHGPEYMILTIILAII